jgi:uncharacterized phage protein (TIGR01671 family)
MERETKYRGKIINYNPGNPQDYTPKNGDWVYGFYVIDKSDRHLIIEYANFKTLTFSMYEVDPETIGRLTPIHEKNDKEIYEGDIVSFHRFTQELGERMGVVEGEEIWNAEITIGELGIWLQADNEEQSGYVLLFNGFHEESFELIGNVHDNPELLK